MSTSLLYHAFGIRGYGYSRTQYDNGQVIFTIHQSLRNAVVRPAGRAGSFLGAKLIAGFIPRPSAASPRSLYCPSRGSNVEPAGWCVRSRCRSPIRGGATRSLSEIRLELSRSMTIRDVAHHQRWLGHGQGHPEARPDTPLCQAQAQAFALHRHRRDRSRQGTPLPDGGHGPGERCDRVRGRR